MTTEAALTGLGATQSRLHAATAERVSLNSVLVDQLNLHPGSTDGSYPLGESFYYQLHHYQLQIPRARLSGAGMESSAAQNRSIESLEILEARQYWSDDEGQLTRNRHTGVAASNQRTGLALAVNRPVTVTALKSRIERWRRKGVEPAEPVSESESSGESSPTTFRRFPGGLGVSEPGKHKANADANAHNGVIEYPSATNPDVTYRKNDVFIDSRSWNWSRTWSAASWLQEEFKAPKNHRYLSPLRVDRKSRSLTEVSAVARSRRMSQGDYVPHISSPNVPAPNNGNSAVKPMSSSIYKKKDENIHHQVSTNRFRQFWDETLKNNAIYSPLDDTLQDAKAESNIGVMNPPRGDKPFVQVAVRPPKVVIHGRRITRPVPSSYQLRRNYGNV